MSAEHSFSKENLDQCFRELGKEYRRLGGKTMPAEIILVGGAAILANYGFRDMTYDIDAVIQAASSMKDAISHVRDRFNLPVGWLNSDFISTKSYTPKLRQYSEYYKTFSNVLTVRTLSGEYLVAMKLMSNRPYKNDISDIIGILWEHQNRNSPISMEQISRAVTNLYGGWETLPENAKPLLERILQDNNLQALYQQSRNEEKEAKGILIEFTKDYPGVVKEDNLENILKALKNRKKDHLER